MKVLLIAIGKIVKASKDPKVIYDAIKDMANVEGVVLAPYDDDD